MKRRYWLFCESGNAFLQTLMIIAVLSLIGTALTNNVFHESRHAGWQLHRTQAAYLAEAAVNEGIHLVTSEAVEEYPYTAEDAPLGNGTYDLSIVYETIQQGAYAIEGYTITGTGRVENVSHTIRVRINRESFLRFSRFVEDSNLTYGSGAVITGDVWAGGDVQLNAPPVVFQGNVSAGGIIRNPEYGQFDQGYSEGQEPIDLATSVDLNYYRNLARGLIPGEGTGIYNSGSVGIDLSLFDFGGMTYDGSPLPADFNGVIFAEGDIYVKGNIYGPGLTIISADDIIIEDHIRTATNELQEYRTKLDTLNTKSGVEQINTYSIDSVIAACPTVPTTLGLRVAGRKWNQIKLEVYEDSNPEPMGTAFLVRRPGSPDDQIVTIPNLEFQPDQHSYSLKLYFKSCGVGANPVWIIAYYDSPTNVGLVARDDIFIHENAPRQLVIHAVLMARDGSWYALGDSSSHPIEYDSSWDLTITGPIITHVGGSAGPWSSYGTRTYRYDSDIMAYPPPHFPVPFGGWQTAYWQPVVGGEAL